MSLIHVIIGDRKFDVERSVLEEYDHFKNMFEIGIENNTIELDYVSPKLFQMLMWMAEGDELIKEVAMLADFLGSNNIYDSLKRYKCKRDSCNRICINNKFCIIHECVIEGCTHMCLLDYKYCNYHKCDKYKCPEMRNNHENYYCKQHMCSVENCKNGKTSWGGKWCDVCEFHKCKIQECGKVSIVNNGFCVNHKCVLDKCNKLVVDDLYSYCGKHKCKVVKCNNHKYYNYEYISDFCDDHLCNHIGCFRKRLLDGKFCRNHIDSKHNID